MSHVQEVLAEGTDPELRGRSDQDLYDEADRLLVKQPARRASPLLPVGLELLQRTRRRGEPDRAEGIRRFRSDGSAVLERP